MSMLVPALILTGAVLLGASIPALLSILSLLRRGPVHRVWVVLTALVAVFFTIYLVLAVLHWNMEADAPHKLIGVLLLLGGAFVLLVSALSRQTVLDVRRIAALERDAFLDPLTGLYNRRYLAERIDDEIALARRQDLALSLLMLDVDLFKRINDDCGHGSGDTVLRDLGRLVAGACRSTDVAVRFGGDEILVLAPNTGLASATNFAERLLREVAATDFATGFPITVSIGLTCLRDDVRTSCELIARADAALYEAKKAGRNRFAIAMTAPAVDLTRPEHPDAGDFGLFGHPSPVS